MANRELVWTYFLSGFIGRSHACLWWKPLGRRGTLCLPGFKWNRSYHTFTGLPLQLPYSSQNPGHTGSFPVHIWTCPARKCFYKPNLHPDHNHTAKWNHKVNQHQGSYCNYVQLQRTSILRWSKRSNFLPWCSSSGRSWCSGWPQIPWRKPEDILGTSCGARQRPADFRRLQVLIQNWIVVRLSQPSSWLPEVWGLIPSLFCNHSQTLWIQAVQGVLTAKTVQCELSG